MRSSRSAPSSGVTATPTQPPRATSDPARWPASWSTSYLAHGVCAFPSPGPMRRRAKLHRARDASAAVSWSQASASRSHPGIEPGVAVAAGHSQPLHEVVPPARVALLLLRRQPLVHQAHRRAALGRLERDRDGGRAGRQRFVALPAPRVDEPLARLHLDERAAGVGTGHDCPAVLAAGPQVDAGRDRLPAPQALWLGQQRERLIGVQRDQDRLLNRHVGFLSSGARQRRVARARLSRTRRGCCAAPPCRPASSR